MKAITYLIRFEPELGFRDIALYLKKIKSPIRLEIGDKITLSLASFDRSLGADKDYIIELVERLLDRSIYPFKYRAFFEISDIVYNHGLYDDDDDYDEFNFHGIITLKGK